MSTAAIAGLGITAVGKVYGRSAADFAADAVRRAAVDSGLPLRDVDGLLISSGMNRYDRVDLSLQNELGLVDLRLLAEINSYGASAGAMIAYAASAVTSGLATAVACVFADAPLQPGRSAGDTYASKGKRPATGLAGLRVASGAVSATVYYALATQRHMATYGTTSEQLGAVAVAQRQWAAMNPLAQHREPLTLTEHQQSRWIAEPLHVLDCCLVSNGGIAVIVTTAERAAELAQPPVHIWGWGQGHPGQLFEPRSPIGLRTGAAVSGPVALRMAGIELADVDLVQLYDCYTFTVLITLEDYGFCPKGDGGPFVADGKLGPGGNLRCNTGGGQLSAFYMWGMTPLSEAVIQARGQAGQRQVVSRDVILVSGNGGVLEHHATLVLSPRTKGGR